MTLPRRACLRVLAGGAAAGLAGCGSAGAGAASPPRTDVPEPAVAPALGSAPAGMVVPMPGAPEGLAVDAVDGVVAVGVRSPDGIVLVDVASGARRMFVPLTGAPRHLQLAGARGPVLVPAEHVNRLFEVSLPDGAVVADVAVGAQPHDAAVAAGGTVFVGNEFADTVSLVRGGEQIAVVPAPVQPGGVTAARDGSVVVVVGVRGRRIEAYTPDGRSLGTAAVGVGPTHVRSSTNGLFYVADTEGDAVLVFRVGQDGPHQVGSAATVSGAPYGLAVDAVRGIVYTTLTASNHLQSFRIAGQGLAADRVWPTVRQPNDVAVDESAGRVIVAGTADGQLQFIDP